jgi:hypothetical protein
MRRDVAFVFYVKGRRCQRFVVALDVFNIGALCWVFV